MLLRNSMEFHWSHNELTSTKPTTRPDVISTETLAGLRLSVSGAVRRTLKRGPRAAANYDCAQNNAFLIERKKVGIVSFSLGERVYETKYWKWRRLTQRQDQAYSQRSES